jgi:hypothetical protein
MNRVTQKKFECFTSTAHVVTLACSGSSGLGGERHAIGLSLVWISLFQDAEYLASAGQLD